MSVAKGNLTGSFLLGLFPLKKLRTRLPIFLLLDKPIKCLKGRTQSLNFLNFFLLGTVLMMNIKL
ncbi:hypothetical protein SRABI27_03662 [Pedobacter sp. Bi27]|nr:hypothetical protein SRABI27_03662 [Pedobacter sp. Bi27]